MKLVGRIPVEPLDDERMTNIERRIVAGAADAAATQPVRESRFAFVLGFAILAVVVMGAGLVGWKLRGGDPSTTMVAETTPLQVHTDLERSTLDIGDARIESGPATAFVVTRPGDGVLVAMTRGKVELEVGKRGSRAPLVVRAGDTDVIVVGTRFSVDYGDGTGEVEVRVTEGVVRVARQQQETRVAAGQAWKTQNGLVALADVGPGLPRKGATIGDTSHRNGNEPIEIDMSNAPGVLHDRTAQVPDTRIPTAGSNTASTNRTTTSGRPEIRSRTLDNPSDPMFDLKKMIRDQPFAPAAEIHEPDSAKAISRYRADAYNQTVRGEAASLAMYSIAWVQAMKLGRTEDAISTLDAYVRRFKGGSEYKDALWLRVRVLCLRNIDDRCRQAAYKYVHDAGSETPTGHIAERLTLSQ